MGMVAQHEINSEEKVRKYHWCKAIPVNNEEWYGYWASCNPNADLCDGGHVENRVGNDVHLWSSTNDAMRRLLEWDNTMIFNDWIRIVHGKVRRDEK